MKAPLNDWMRYSVAWLAILATLNFEVTAQQRRPRSVESALVDRYALEAPKNLPPLKHVPSSDAMPNYVAGARWGTEAEHIRTMQVPLKAEASKLHFALQHGFGIELWAEEPQITKPIAMAWDEKGRLWIAETVDYPNELKPSGEGRDRIKVCEDTDADGKADKFTIFADKLSIPTSLVFAEGGLIVSQAPDMVFLKDTDGDGVADYRKVLFTGWGTGDTHAGPSNLRYGLDNWVWGTVGYSGFNGVVGGKTNRFGMGVFRFKPDGSVMEFIRSSNNNTWGLGISEEGIVFGSTANRNASFYVSIPNRFYESVSGWSAARMETIADSQAIYPVTSNVRQVDQHGMYTAGAGHALYTARVFPKHFWNRIAFVTEPTGHLVGWFRLDAEGADFKARNLGSFMASSDEWSAPIVAEVGPDGAVWVLDWYNYIVQHNPTPAGFRTGKGNAYETSLRDKHHGRIYRVVYMGEGKPKISEKHARIRPGLQTVSGLVTALSLDNQLWRMHAQRLLVEQKRVEAVPTLVELVRSRVVDEIGLSVGAIHALWTLHGLGVVDSRHPEVLSAIGEALSHPSAGARRAAAGVLPRTAAGARMLRESGILRDGDSQVRLAGLLAAAEMPSEAPMGEVLAGILGSAATISDQWLREGLISAASRHHEIFIPSLAKVQVTDSEALSAVVRQVARHHVTTLVADRFPGLLTTFKGASPAVVAALLDGIMAGVPENVALPLTDPLREALTGVIGLDSDGVKERVVTLARRWGGADAFTKEASEVEERLRSVVSNPTATENSRLAAARSLVRLKDGAETVSFLLNQLNAQSSPAFASGLISGVSESRSAESASSLLGAWRQFTPTGRRVAITTLSRRTEWAKALLAAIEANTISKGELGQEHWQQLRTNPDRAIAGKARDLANATNPISADREAVIKKLMPLVEQKGDAARGKEVYKANCAVCHVFQGEGSKIGPELTGIGSRSRADLLVEILDPNRSVEANYRLWNVTTRTGETVSGRLDAETATSIEVTDLTGQKHVVARADISTLEGSNLSIMPAGFESLPESDIAALLEFLAASGKH